jgi:RHS repeat-associated protein
VQRRYAFKGGKQREALTSGGTVAMGVRLYVPRNGRFAQVDPILGGSANAYDYTAQDPINNEDVDGKKIIWKHRFKISNLIAKQMLSVLDNTSGIFTLAGVGCAAAALGVITAAESGLCVLATMAAGQPISKFRDQLAAVLTKRPNAAVHLTVGFSTCLTCNPLGPKFFPKLPFTKTWAWFGA